MTAALDRPPALFDVFGEGIAVHADDAELHARIVTALAPFRSEAVAPLRAEFHLRRTAAPSPILVGNQYGTAELLVIVDRHKLIAASLAAEPWQIHVEAYERGDDYVYFYLFEPLLHMVLKRRGLVPWHGAAVAARDGTVLIVGAGGAGKSTTTLSLLLHGYGFIADDEVFLRLRDDRVVARGAERHLHFTDRTAALLDGLPPAHTLAQVPRGTARKRRLSADFFSRPPQAGGEAAGIVRLVLFSRVDPTADTSLTPLAPAEALRRLLLQRPKEHPAVLPDKPSLERQFAACATLATSARAGELVLGRDLGCVPELVDDAVA